MKPSRPPRDVVEAAIIRTRGNLTRAAALLECSRPTLYKWIYQLGLQERAGIRNLDSDYGLHVNAAGPSSNHSGSAGVNAQGSQGTTLGSMTEAGQEDVKVAATIRVRESVWKRLRKAAIDRGCTASELAEQGLQNLLGAEAPPDAAPEGGGEKP